MKKSIFVLLVIPFVLSACGGGGGDSKSQTSGTSEEKECTLEFYVYDNASQYKRLATQFNGLHPKWTINVREDKASYFDHLKTYFGADMAPDMFFMEPGEIAPFIRDDLLLDLEPYITSGTDLKVTDLWEANDGYRYNPTTKEYGTKDGHLFALAKDLSADYAMVYNKSHIDEYNSTHTTTLKDEIGYPSDDGIYPSETTPMSWEQNELFCYKLTKMDKTGFARYGTVFDYTPWRHTMEWIQQQGSFMFSSDGTKFNAEDPNVIAAFTHLTNYCYGDHISSTPLDTKSVDTGIGFKSGSVSVVWAGRWSFKAYNWDECDFEVGIAPGPVRKLGDPVYSSTNYVGLSIASTSKNPDVAYKFYEYLLTAGVRQEIRNGNSFNVPSNKTIASSDAYLDPEDPIEKKLNNYFYNLTLNAKPLKWSPYIDTTTLESCIALSYGATWDKTESHKTPAQALLNAKKDIENEIRKVIGRL